MVSDPLLLQMDKCPTDLSSYLEASYQCVESELKGTAGDWCATDLCDSIMLLLLFAAASAATKIR